MGERMEQLGEAAVVLITFTRARNLVGYRGRLGLPFPVVTDEERTVYRAYGLGRGDWKQVWGPATIRRYGELLKAGRRLQKPTEDILQLGGDFVVGPDGRLAYVFRSEGPDDRPPIDDLVAAVAGAA